MKNVLALALVLLTVFVTLCNQNHKIGLSTDEFQELSDDSLLSLVQFMTLQYFVDGAEPVSGMARERYHVDGIYPENDMNVVTTGGSGFGIMAIIAGIDRGFISRQDGVFQLWKIVNFLNGADRFHGAFPHWLYGETGKVKPFSSKDDGADIVETAYLMQGLLTARQYLMKGSFDERKLAGKIDSLWKAVEWDWFTRGGEDILYWHWSPDYGWEMNHQVRGYNECLILYILAASSPSHSIGPDVYHQGWAKGGDINGYTSPYGYTLRLKHDGATEYGGPLFWAHYSYLGPNPMLLKDIYADYWQENVNHTLINWKWCSLNPGNYKGYGEKCWGLTASYSPGGYFAHRPGPGTDLGVISPTAAVSSIPYTPDKSMAAIRHFYFELGSKIWGKYGFYDAFSEQSDWFPQRYLAIDEGPIVVMIENYRTGLLWNLFMSCPEIKAGLKKLGFESIK
ncbi:MAG TPA: glucoamylase family protein [Bacteroidales bacterium]|nr:beta-glucosidase [Bacteroidales bacterium]HRC89718.1 glucoamylase family protein [Bacteroidales bacterium]